MGSVLNANPSAAARADAGSCFELGRRHAACLPSLINIGVQKAGTGELQTWLGAHPRVRVHVGAAVRRWCLGGPS